MVWSSNNPKHAMGPNGVGNSKIFERWISLDLKATDRMTISRYSMYLLELAENHFPERYARSNSCKGLTLVLGFVRLGHKP
jgi:hypothetical protein